VNVELALARATGGSTIPNTAATRLMANQKHSQQIRGNNRPGQGIVRVKVLAIVPAAWRRNTPGGGGAGIAGGGAGNRPGVAEIDPVVAGPERVR